MSYGVEWPDEQVSVEPGTSMLVGGDAGVTEQRLFDAVAPEDGEQAIVVTNDVDAGTVVAELESRDAEREQIGVIDSTGQEIDVEDVAVRPLGSPGDLTGISLEFAKLLEREDVEPGPVRVGFASVSTALMYADLRTMFRFLHVFTARIRSGEMLGVFSMDPAMHEEQAHNTIRAVFDCEVKATADDVELRGTGFER